MGSVWELTAFILRSLGSRDQQNAAYATTSQILFLLAPLWVNAFVYMTAGRLVYMLHPDKKIWSFKAISTGKWFVWLDILSFLVQAAGGLMLGPDVEQRIMDIGKTIYMSGVGLQQFFILLFLALIVRFHLDALKLDRQGLLGEGDGKRNRWWKFLIHTIYAVLALITMRISFRLVEFSGGMDPAVNQLPYKEGYALGLDAFPMALATLLLAIIHPGLVLKGPDSNFPSRKELKAEKKANKKEKKRLKEEKKASRTVDTAYKPGVFSTVEERSTHEDVEMGFVGTQGGKVERC